MVSANPDAALAMMSGSTEGAGVDFGLRAPIASQMINSGRREEGLRIIDRTVAEFAAISPTPAQWHGYVSFLQQVTYAAPDRFLEAFHVLTKAGPPPAGGSGRSHAFPGPAGQVVVLDEQEAMALNLLRGLHQRPELMLKALESMPSLKSKVEQLGGIDSALNPGDMGRFLSAHPNALYRKGHRTNPDGSMAGEADPNTPAAIHARIRGKMDTEPQFVRRTLADAFRGPEDAGRLLELAMAASGEDPDLSSLAIQMALPLVRRVDSPEQRMHLFQQLVSITRQCDGEVDPELIKEGFVLVDELREQEEKKPANVPVKPGTTAADQFEMFLVAELARDNFTAAIRYARSLQDDSMKLATLLRIVQGCREY
jgi:hypothetical protein